MLKGIKLNELNEKNNSTIGLDSLRRKLNNTKGFIFDPKSHRYTLDGVQLISGTELISKYEGNFDSAIISEVSAKKYAREGNTILSDARLVRKYWKLLGEHASTLGTSGHTFCQLCWLNKDIVPVTQLDINAKKAMMSIMDKYDILEMEVPRGNKKYMIGYTIDILLRHKLTGEIIMGDFKFSNKFTAEQYKGLKGKQPSTMLEPFKEFRKVAHDKGSIQLELYSQLLKEDTGIEATTKVLIHIDGLGSERFYGEKGYKTYITKDCKSQVSQILKPLEGHDSIVDML